MRCTLLILCLLCSIYAIKYLPLVFVSLVQSTGPLWISLLGYYLLKESISRVYVICLIVAFLGVALMIVGTVFRNDGNEDESVQSWEINANMIYPFIAIIMNPIIAAFN